MSPATTEPRLTLRAAGPADVQALQALIARSARGLSAGFYSATQIESLVRYVFGVDTTLIRDATYFLVEDGATPAACGGWSRRRTLYGGDQRPVGTADELDPATDAARIRAFFVDPAFARRGIGRLLLAHCENEARAAGFRRLELMATLPGVPLYAAAGFREIERVTDVLPDGTAIDFVRMGRPVSAKGTP
jgi:GNAT superfamily N-acetyltransferase